MNKFAYLSLIALIIIPITDNALADVFQIQIPTDASKIDSTSHFIPQEISVSAGDVVEWGNGDGEVHTITSGSLEAGVDGKFNSGYLKTGDKFLQTFYVDDIGEFKYFCTIHPWMTGIINVVDLPEGFRVIHNVGSEVSEKSFDIPYKVQRSLSEIKIDDARDMLVFNFVGKIDNDIFTVYLPQELLKNPQSVWVGNNQITNFDLESTNKGTTLTIPLEGHTTQVKIVGTDVIGEFTEKPYILINQISTITDKQSYNPNDAITISGKVNNHIQLTKITSEIISPNGVTLYSKDITLKNSRFSFNVNTDVLREFGQYKVSLSGKNINSPVIYFNYELTTKQISPNKQMNSVEPGDVACNEGLELYMKNSNGRAVCLSESTGMILLQRGFVDYF